METTITKQELKMLIMLVYMAGTVDGAKGDFDRVYLERLFKSVEERKS